MSMDAPWIDWVGKNRGQKEIKGKSDNPFIVALFKHTTYGQATDETPWCAATACAALEETGFKSPHSAAAKDFIDYGEPCILKPGCIVVLQHQDGGHHVAFLDHVVNADYVCLLGGNQNDQINNTNFKRSEIVATRWPIRKD